MLRFYYAVLQGADRLKRLKSVSDADKQTCNIG